MPADVPTNDRPIRLDVRPLSGVIGAEIRGVNLKEPLDDAMVAEIRGLLLRFKVIFFPKQHLAQDEHIAFARRFGDLAPAHPLLPGIPGYPEILELDYTKIRELYALGPGAAPRESQDMSWHTDMTFVERPSLGSILNAIVIPEAGGDTLWSNQVAAYEGLSETMRRFLGTLTAIHDGRGKFTKALDRIRGDERPGSVDEQFMLVEHPVIRTHPETGERALFVNPDHTSHIKELTRAESNALLAFLYAHSTRSEYTVRYHWSAGDLAFWDNRVTQHTVVIDFGTQHRVMQRVVLRGDRPV